jgi:hypothetical protein
MYIELKMWKALTPLIVAFSGITVISVLHSTLGGYLGFFDVNPEVFLYISYFLAIAFASSLFVFLIFSYTRIQHSYLATGSQSTRACAPDGSRIDNTDLNKSGLVAADLIPGRVFDNSFAAYLFLGAVLLLLIFVLYSILRAYVSAGEIAGEEFEHALSYGIVGHSFALLMACVPFLYLFSKLSVSRYVRRLCFAFLVLCFLFLFMKQVKYWVLVPLIWILVISFRLYGFSFNMSLFYKGVGGSAIAIILFFIVYLVQIVSGNDGVSALDIPVLLLDIFYHLLGYAFSGLLVFSSLIDDGVFYTLNYKDAAVAFEGLFNILGALVGGGLYDGDHFVIEFYVLDDVFNKTGNVGTLWADFLIYMGIFAFPIYFIMFFLLYFLFMLSRFSFLAFIYYTGIVSFLFFSWFSSYFKLLSPYEIPLLSVFVAVLLIFLSRVKVGRVEAMGNSRQNHDAQA